MTNWEPARFKHFFMPTSPASHLHFPEIIEILEDLHLDMDSIDPDQFVVCVTNDAVVGAGRIIEYDSSLELCSVGVLPEHRGIGIGRNIVEDLLRQYPEQPVYVVTDIPDFFARFGFTPVENFPEEIALKRQKCLSELDCHLAQVMVAQA